MAHAIAPIGRQHQGQRIAVSPRHGRGHGGGPCRALAKAPELGFDTFIISAKTPFSRDDCAELIADAPAVVARLFPRYREIYARLGWTMFDSIDRVYDSSKAARRAGIRVPDGVCGEAEGVGGVVLRPGALPGRPLNGRRRNPCQCYPMTQIW